MPSGGVPYKNVSFVLRTGSGDNDVTELKLSLWSNKPNERQFGNNPYEVISNLKVGTAVLKKTKGKGKRSVLVSLDVVVAF